MCIDAPEWTTNSRSSGLSDVEGAGIPITSPGFFRGVVRILELVKIIIIAKSHAASLAHRSCVKVSSCDISSNFGAQGPRL